MIRESLFSYKPTAFENFSEINKTFTRIKTNLSNQTINQLQMMANKTQIT